MNSYDEWSSLLETYAVELGDQALKELHVHLSGIEYTEKGEKNHLPIEESDFEMRELFSVFNDFNCCGRILCESPTLEEDALIMKRNWEEFHAQEGSS